MSGCCVFIPCHSATFAIGYVYDENKKPIEGVKIKLYGIERITNENGCFYYSVADALPFKLIVKSENFKPLKTSSKTGYFKIKIIMVPLESRTSSQVVWSEIDSNQYRSIKKCT